MKKAYGPYALGAQPAQVESLLRGGLTLIRHLDEHGKPCGDSVLPTSEVPSSYLLQQARPCPTIGACHADAWRPDRGTGLSFICGRCHP